MLYKMTWCNALMAIQMYTIDWQNAKQTKSRLFHYITLMLPDVAKKSI